MAWSNPRAHPVRFAWRRIALADTPLGRMAEMVGETAQPVEIRRRVSLGYQETPLEVKASWASL